MTLQMIKQASKENRLDDAIYWMFRFCFSDGSRAVAANGDADIVFETKFELAGQALEKLQENKKQAWNLAIDILGSMLFEVLGSVLLQLLIKGLLTEDDVEGISDMLKNYNKERKAYDRIMNQS